MERETGFEPATSSLGSWHSTTELLPQPFVFNASEHYFIRDQQMNSIIILSPVFRGGSPYRADPSTGD
jgi:hypothetical protein